jgi:hypothetical protein
MVKSQCLLVKSPYFMLKSPSFASCIILNHCCSPPPNLFLCWFLVVFFLIGAFNPPEKYESQIGSSSPIWLGKIKFIFQTTVTSFLFFWDQNHPYHPFLIGFTNPFSGSQASPPIPPDLRPELCHLLRGLVNFTADLGGPKIQLRPRWPVQRDGSNWNQLILVISWWFNHRKMVIEPRNNRDLLSYWDL